MESNFIDDIKLSIFWEGAVLFGDVGVSHCHCQRDTQATLWVSDKVKSISSNHCKDFEDFRDLWGIRNDLLPMPLFQILSPVAQAMSNTRNFISFISKSEFSVDYWFDDAVIEAISLANSLPADDWHGLCQNWQALSELGQARLAQVAGEVENLDPATIQMLLAMLRSEAREVVDMSIDALYAIAQVNPERIRSEDMKRALLDIKGKGSAVSRILESLRAILDSP